MRQPADWLALPMGLFFIAALVVTILDLLGKL